MGDKIYEKIVHSHFSLDLIGNIPQTRLLKLPNPFFGKDEHHKLDQERKHQKRAR